MPIHFKYNPDKDALYGSIEGKVTIDELRQALTEITKSDEFPADARTLWDLRKLDFSDIDRKFAEQLVSLRQLNPERGNTKIAIIAEDDLAFGMGRLYEMHSEGLPQRMMVFRDYAEGEKWLLEGD